MFSPVSPSRSDEDDEDDEIRVIWKTGPTQKPRSRPPPRPSTSIDSPQLDCNSTPKPKRSTTTAGLPSPSAPLSSSDRPHRVTKQQKKKKRACFASKKQEVPMDASTLQLVSQLAMKVQARSQPGYETPLASTSGRRKEVESSSSRRKGKVEVPPGRPLETKTNISQLGLSSPRIRFSSTKSSVTAAKDSPAGQKRLQSLARSEPLPLVQPDFAIAHKNPAPVASQVEEEDFDSYFDEFVDESFELALSQLDDVGSTKTCGTSPMVNERCEMGEKGIQADEIKVQSDLAKKRDVAELARKEIESLGDLSGWDEDDFWIDD